MRRAWVAGIVIVVAAAVVTVAPVQGDAEAEAAGRDRLNGELGATVRDADWGAAGRAEVKVGVTVVDLANGDTVYETDAERALNPASNAKLLVMAAALGILGADFTVTTSLLGPVEGDTVQGDVVLRGRGDPTLVAGDLWQLARDVRAQGIVRVTGGIAIDDSYFGDGPLPFAFDSQPNEDNEFRAPVGAAGIDADAVAVWIGPGAAAGEPAGVWAWPEGFLDLDNEALTNAGAGNSLALYASAGADGRTAARVWGRIGVGAAWASYPRRIDDPLTYAGMMLREALRSAGVAVDGESIVRGSAPEGAATLAKHVSDPLGSWLWKLGKESSNYHAEQTLRIVGAERKGAPGTAEKGAEAVVELLAEWGVPADGLVLRNGSGLFTADEVSPRTLAALLRAVYLDASIRPDFLAALAVAGRDGTLANRLRGATTKGLVRAKTGTLAAVSALSGYVLSPDGRAGYAFSVLVNDGCGRTGVAREVQDGIVRRLADELR
ncbi:MAG: D-alanyl-D-alanine carboxypeptidase/D-alanyl-D-alanine-endopeptidase [Deltaproteobacteria bacterium]|nr:D-alanyl-D-alanine carboxypeptidase/D-alanyl-D-alanine-endopeptidase [Deltaproteobacteria bacterium]